MDWRRRRGRRAGRPFASGPTGPCAFARRPSGVAVLRLGCLESPRPLSPNPSPEAASRQSLPTCPGSLLRRLRLPRPQCPSPFTPVFVRSLPLPRLPTRFFPALEPHNRTFFPPPGLPLVEEKEDGLALAGRRVRLFRKAPERLTGD